MTRTIDTRPRRRAWVTTVVLGAALTLAGGAGVLLGLLQSVEGGSFSSEEQRFTSTTAALKTDEIEVGSETAVPADPRPDVGELARVRVSVRAEDSRTPIFVGIGRKTDVEAYLRGTSYDEFDSARLSPFAATFRTVPGSSVAAAPAGQSFWVATAAGAGPQVLEWDKTGGAWSMVVMRLDGSPGVDVRVAIGLRFGFLLPVGIGLTLGGPFLIAVALRRLGRAQIRRAARHPLV